jgi:hypothetical protein
MTDDKWWGKAESEKEAVNSKEEVEEMMNHTEMMKIKREEEIAQAQHEFNMSEINQEMLGTKAGSQTPEMNNQNAATKQNGKEGSFSWMTDDPGYLFLAIIVSLGFIASILGSILVPDVDEIWGITDATVLEGTEWIEYDNSYEECSDYDDYDDYCYGEWYWVYSYDCYADVYYNYSISGTEYFGEYYLFIDEFSDYCLEEVEYNIIPINSTLDAWYKIEENEMSQLESPSDSGSFLAFLGLCCLLPILLSLLFFMYFEGNNDEYHNSSSNESNELHHYHHGGGIMGGIYYGSPWYRRPWFHRRRSRRRMRISVGGGRRSSGGGRRSSGGGRRSSGGGRRSSGGGRRSGGGGRRSR